MNRFIAAFIFFGFFFFLSITKIYAQPQTAYSQLPTTNYQLPTTNYQLPTNYIPQVTFGDLLNGNYTPPPPDYQKLAANKYRKIQEFLKIVEENGRKSALAFPAASPDPAVSTLADNIAAYFITPVPTLHPKLEQILAMSDSIKSSDPFPFPSNLGDTDLSPLKSAYTIALLGDSMTDTLGPDLPHLSALLKKSYPSKNFSLLNYGQGATNLEQGLFRLTRPTKYLDRDYPPLLHLNPDIIVIESFAYNHWGAELSDLNRQWTTLVNIIDTVKNYSPDIKILALATISPNPLIYGDGILNWPDHLKWDGAITTKAYLQNFINFAGSARLPLADAYNPSLNSQGHGDPKFINASDHLHPSEEGKQLIARKILEAIRTNNLIK